MHILIVEDSDFNAFCLKRLLESVHQKIQITTVNDSVNALQACENQTFDAIIIDGDLGAGNGLCCNGAALADAIWSKYPQQTLISWTDSDFWRNAFAEVFKQYQKPFNDNYCWPKVVSYDRIRKLLSHSTSITNKKRAAAIDNYSDTAQ